LADGPSRRIAGWKRLNRRLVDDIQGELGSPTLLLACVHGVSF
jgi:hypothetical protein